MSPHHQEFAVELIFQLANNRMISGARRTLDVQVFDEHDFGRAIARIMIVRYELQIGRQCCVDEIVDSRRPDSSGRCDLTDRRCPRNCFRRH